MPLMAKGYLDLKASMSLNASLVTIVVMKFIEVW